jgi:WD40 repeat protein
MAANLDQPDKFDAALGDGTRVEFDDAVLGGLAGLRQQIFNPNLAIAPRIAALAKALDYDAAGLNLVLDLLRDRHRTKYGEQREPFKQAAYELVRSRPDPKIRQLILKYNPYQFFHCRQVFDPVESIAEQQRSPMIATMFTFDQQRLISGSEDGWLRLWDCQSPLSRESWRSGTEKLTAIAFDHDYQATNQLVATGTDTGLVKVWHLDPGNEIVQLPGHGDRIAALVLGDRFLISSSRDGMALVWDWRSQQLIYELSGHIYPVAAVAIGTNGNLIATASRDAIKVWDLRTGQIVRHLGSHYPIAALVFSPDENFLIVACKDKTIKVWDLWRKRINRTLKGHTSTVDCLAMSKDGLVLVSAGRDRTLKIWNWRSGKLLHSLGDGLPEQDRHSADIEAVAISNDGGAIVSASRDGTLRLWGMPTIQ